MTLHNSCQPSCTSGQIFSQFRSPAHELNSFMRGTYKKSPCICNMYLNTVHICNNWKDNYEKRSIKRKRRCTFNDAGRLCYHKIFIIFTFFLQIAFVQTVLWSLFLISTGANTIKEIYQWKQDWPLLPSICSIST